MKISSLLWIMKRPEYWKQGLEIVKRRFLLRNDELGMHEAVKWCQQNAISESAALKKIIHNVSNSFESVSSLLKDDYLDALNTQKNCPVEMGGPGALDLLYHLVKHLKPENIIETGVAYGWSSWAILQATKHYEARLISIDMPYVNMDNDKYVGCCVPPSLRAKWTLISKADRQGIPIALKTFNGTIDMCHYDSDKSYSGRHWAYNLLWKHLVPGGIFISDDIQDNIAFMEFCESINKESIIVESQGKYVGVLQKTPND